MYNLFEGNVSYDNKRGFLASTDAQYNTWTNGTIINQTEAIPAWEFQAWLEGPNNTISDSLFVDLSSSAQDYAVKLEGNYSRADNIKCVNFERAIHVASGCDYARILRPEFVNCNVGLRIEDSTCDQTRVGAGIYIGTTTPVTDGGTGTIYDLRETFQFTEVSGGSAVIQATNPIGCYVSGATNRQLRGVRYLIMLYR